MEHTIRRSNMKKIIVAAAAVLLSGMAFAQDISLEVGGRASFDVNIFDFKNGENLGIDNDVWVDSLKPKPGFGVNALVNIGFPIGIGIQPEVGFHYHTAGFKMKGAQKTNTHDPDDDSYVYMTLDVPILVTYKANISDVFFIRPELGPKISFTLGRVGLKAKYEKDDDKWDEIHYSKIKSPFNFGISAGVGFGFNLGGGALLIDARYNRDFTKVKMKEENYDFEVGSPQSIEISVGYSVKVM